MSKLLARLFTFTVLFKRVTVQYRSIVDQLPLLQMSTYYITGNLNIKIKYNKELVQSKYPLVVF